MKTYFQYDFIPGGFRVYVYDSKDNFPISFILKVAESEKCDLEWANLFHQIHPDYTEEFENNHIYCKLMESGKLFEQYSEHLSDVYNSDFIIHVQKKSKSKDQDFLFFFKLVMDSKKEFELESTNSTAKNSLVLFTFKLSKLQNDHTTKYCKM